VQINKQIAEKDSLKCHLSKCIYKVICFRDIWNKLAFKRYLSENATNFCSNPINNSIEEKTFSQNFFSKTIHISNGIKRNYYHYYNNYRSIVYIILQQKNKRKDTRCPIFTINSNPCEYPKSTLKRSKSIKY